MAVGRRKRFYSGVLTNAFATVFTAGTAPTDGSAADSVTITFCNYDSVSHVVSLNDTGGISIVARTLTAGETWSYPATIDLMGAEAIQAKADANSVCSIRISGVEAKDA